MELTMKKQTPAQHEDNNILRMLDRGIDDMEAGREDRKSTRLNSSHPSSSRMPSSA